MENGEWRMENEDGVTAMLAPTIHTSSVEAMLTGRHPGGIVATRPV